MSLPSLIPLIIWIVIIGLMFYAVWWFLSKVGLPEPFNKVAQVIVALVALLVVLYFLSSIAPFPRLVHY